VLAGDYDSALDGYENSLAQYRTIRFAVARERVLYDIRALRRQVGPGPISQRISNILAAEPEKRYVARFPRSQLPLLRILSIIAVPLALLMLAIIAPTEAVRQIANLASFQIIFDPLRALWVLMVLVLLYSGAYALVALAVIFFVKLGDLSREQPDYFVTDEQQISRYDYRGALAQQIRWDELRRWVRVDRKLWARPVSLLSSTYLEARDGQDMRIDGITGWYQNVQEDIDLHLKAQGHQVESRDGGFTVLRSKSGASLAVGTLLLVLFISAQNTWAQWLIALLPPQLYAVFSLIAFSGLLMLLPIAYWGAINPLRLRRMLGIRDYWPYAVMLVSAIAIAVGVLQMVPRVPPLNFGLVLVGALTFGYALGVVVAPVQQLLRRLIIAISLLCATSYIGWNVLPTFLQIVSRVGAYQAVLSASEAAPNPNGSWASAQTAIEAAQQIINDPSAAAEQKAQAYINQGLAYDSIRRYDLAVRSYSEALNIYGVMPQSETTQQARATAHYNRYVALFALGQPWQNDLNTACRLYFSVGPDCANPPQ
jgi:tetratricopeptide (TPR) repeat protein